MFIGVFFDFINNFAKNYTSKLLVLVLSSTIAACLEFAGLSFIYIFVALLTKNSIYLPILSQYELFQSKEGVTLGLGIIVAIIYILKDLFMIIHINFQNSLLTKISNDIFKKNYARFISQNYLKTRKIPLSDKFKILDNSITSVVNIFCGSVLSLFANMFLAFSIILYLFIKFQINAIIISIFIFTIWFFENKYLKYKAKKHGEMLHYSEREKYNFVLSTIDSQKDIIIYNKKNAFSKKAYELQKNCSNQRKIVTINSQLPTYLTEISIMSTFIIFVALLLIRQCDLTYLAASLATIAAIVIRLIPAINKTQFCLQAINASKVEVQWFCNTIKTLYKEPPVQETEKKMPFQNIIKFDNVNFSYEKNTPALKNISFEIQKGEFIGITGSSGSGKTTLFNLICGLFSPDEGRILIDNICLNNKNIKKWQNNISILSQEFSLPFNTVWQNITLEPDCNHKKDNSKIIQSLKFANIYNEIDGNIEKNANELSSGQKHRIALARAFYFDRELLMLDEATAALDVKTEDEIGKSIEKIKGKKTIIAIAHRLKTLKNCDKIIYINNGKIIDIGTLNQLKEKHASFEKMIELSGF